MNAKRYAAWTYEGTEPVRLGWFTAASSAEAAKKIAKLHPGAKFKALSTAMEKDAYLSAGNMEGKPGKPLIEILD